MLNKSTYETGDGGEVLVKNKKIEYTRSLYSAIYYRLFGGNTEESTKREATNTEFYEGWWGNDPQGDSDKWINSDTERILLGMTITTPNIIKLETAVKKDLRDIQEYGEVEVDVTYPSLNKIEITITVSNTNGKEEVLIVWDATRNEVIESKVI